MGTCSNLIRPKALNLKQDFLLHKYNRSVAITIKSRDPFGAIIKDEHLEVILPEPKELFCEKISLPFMDFWVSKCILSGFDPRGETFKKCQDHCFILQGKNSILIGLFDGHGPEGDKVVFYCASFTEKYFSNNASSEVLNSSDFDPRHFLISLTEKCDKDLRENSMIDCTFSGSTAVFLLITSLGIFTASVGDSRAVLALSVQEQELIQSSFLPSMTRVKLKEQRPKIVQELVYALQLTKDQKPEDPEELQRLLGAGARVKRLVDDFGNRIGPYRVWEMQSNIPGLTMSRSLGDNLAKNLGVISTPIFTQQKLDLSNNLFIVVASDGVWDTIDNIDACNFIEFYRSKTLRSAKIMKNSTISHENTCIAQLLCEEARARWLHLVETEDVIIDDISCIILEISNKHSIKCTQSNKAQLAVFEDSLQGNQDLLKAPTISETKIKDPRRGSFVISISPS